MANLNILIQRFHSLKVTNGYNSFCMGKIIQVDRKWQIEYYSRSMTCVYPFCPKSLFFFTAIGYYYK